MCNYTHLEIVYMQVHDRKRQLFTLLFLMFFCGTPLHENKLHHILSAPGEEEGSGAKCFGLPADAKS